MAIPIYGASTTFTPEEVQTIASGYGGAGAPVAGSPGLGVFDINAALALRAQREADERRRQLNLDAVDQARAEQRRALDRVAETQDRAQALSIQDRARRMSQPTTEEPSLRPSFVKMTNIGGAMPGYLSSNASAPGAVASGWMPEGWDQKPNNATMEDPTRSALATRLRQEAGQEDEEATERWRKANEARWKPVSVSG